MFPRSDGIHRRGGTPITRVLARDSSMSTPAAGKGMPRETRDVVTSREKNRARVWIALARYFRKARTAAREIHVAAGKFASVRSRGRRVIELARRGRRSRVVDISDR